MARLSHRVCGLVPGQGAGQVILDAFLGLAAVLVAELHADAGGALALCALGRHPDHPTRDRELFVLAHEVEEHEDLIPKPVVAIGRNEQATIADEWHIGQVERALVFDGEREQSWLVDARSGR